MDCPECFHDKTLFILSSDQARKACFYHGYDINKQQDSLTVTYNWNRIPGPMDGEPPGGGPVDHNYNSLGDGNYGYYTRNQTCLESESGVVPCTSGTAPFLGYFTTPTGQSSTIANIGTSNGAGLNERYDVDDTMYLGVQEWALISNTLEFGTIIGPNKGSVIDTKHSGLHTRGPRLGFRVGMVPSPWDPSPCIICPDKAIFECFVKVDDTGYEEVCPGSNEECDNPVMVPRAKADDDGRGYVNVGFLVQSNMVTTEKYVRFLNTIAVNDYYGGSDFQLWHHHMMPNIKRLDHSDPIHKYSYIANPKALNLPVTNVNLYGAIFYVKWMNAYFCNPFRYSQYELDNNAELSNCEDCVDSIDNAPYSYSGD